MKAIRKVIVTELERMEKEIAMVSQDIVRYQSLVDSVKNRLESLKRERNALQEEFLLLN